MADAPRDSSHPQTDDMHWGISYLREDIQDLRQEIRGTHGRIDAVNESLTGRIDAVNESLGRRIDAMTESLLRRIDAKFAQLLAAMFGMTGIIIGAVFAMLQMHTH